MLAFCLTTFGAAVHLACVSKSPHSPTERARLDLLLVEKGLAESREQAQRLILAGKVHVAGIARPKAGMKIDSQLQITVEEPERYVSRGGLKLEGALQGFNIDPTGLICADIGASTGGFTDCLLQHGATKVYAIDVGRTQMHERLRKDPRVILIEQTNARNLTGASLPEQPELFVADVSFISLDKILPPLLTVAADRAEAVVLFKPQFEATREEVARGRGVLRDPALHRRLLTAFVERCPNMGWFPVALMPSPITGGSGNREYLFRLTRDSQAPKPLSQGIDIDAVVALAFKQPG